MKAIIITIGDEILHGQTIDTNSAWLAVQLNLLGLEVHEIVSVSDRSGHIMSALDHASKNAGLILITGGLGPTNDDITKKTLAVYFDSELIFNQEILDDLMVKFSHTKLATLERNREQAMIPDKCIPIANNYGSAPGMMFEKEGTVFISMPGVPYEMKSMFSENVIEQIKNKFELPAIAHRFILTAGYGESVLAEKLIDFEKHLPIGVSLAYLPSSSAVKLRLTAKGKKQVELDNLLDGLTGEINQLIPKAIFGFGADNSLEKEIGRILMANNATLGTAESCTGGYISHVITSVPGSSGYYKGSLITYSNELKINELEVKESTLENYGAVSAETVREMHAGLLNHLHIDFGIAVTGIAGPDGGTPEKPVGTVWIAVGDKENVQVKLLHLGKKRVQNIERTAVLSLNLLRRFLLERFV